jgi:hypothetical protein
VITPSYIGRVERLLFEDESVVFTARQRRVGPGGSILRPSVIVATNERLLLLKDVLSLHLREDIETIPYANMTYVKIEHGLISSALLIGVLGFGRQMTEFPSGTMAVEGLRYTDAVSLEQLIDKMIIKIRGKEPAETFTTNPPAEEMRSKESWRVMCKRCKTMNDFEARYCSSCGTAL